MNNNTNDFDEYQEQTRTTAIYPDEGAVSYIALGLNGEAGELAEKIKKYIREDDEQYLDEAESELGDVLWYLARLADELGVSLGDVAEDNLAKLHDRQQRDVLTGQGDNR
jgi:NTP pyrophosphatase (non-canonical NTP hydrolase)